MSHYIATDELLLAPWDRLVRQLANRGWGMVPSAVRPRLLRQLADPSYLRLAYPPDEGFESATDRTMSAPLLKARPVVQDLSMRLLASLSVAAELHRLPTFPLFNEVHWTSCLRASERTPAADRPSPWISETSLGAVIEIVLGGTAVFQFASSQEPRSQCPVDAGDLLLIRGANWPTCSSSPTLYDLRVVTPPFTFMTLRSRDRPS